MLITQSITFFLNFLICNESKSKSTVISYQTDLNQFNEFLRQRFRLTKVEQITYQHILDFKRCLTNEKTLMATTVNRKIDCLKKYFDTLEKLNKIEENPIKFVRGVKFDRTAHCEEYLTTEELAQVLDYTETLQGANGRRDRLLIKTVAYLGIRRGDCLSLNWSNVDFVNETIHFVSEKTCQSETQVIHPQLLEELKSYYNFILPTDLDTPIFLSNEKKRLSKTAFTRIFTELNKNCGVNKRFNITSKTFRHTLLTILINEQGVDLLTAQRIAGHRDRRSIEYYVDTTRNQRRRAITGFMANYKPKFA